MTHITDPVLARDLKRVIHGAFHPSRHSLESSALRYLAGMSPEITPGDDDLQWASPDASATVDVAEDLGVCVYFQLGDSETVVLSDPLQTVRAILSAWMTTNDLET